MSYITTSFQPRTRIKINDKTVLGSDSLKLLGVHLDSDVSFNTHVEKMAAKMRSKTWALSKLRKRGLDEQKLVRAYKCLIRPTVEYAAPVWHSLITASQAASLERQQSQALKNIYGPSLSARKMRQKADLPSLNVRRETLVLNFAKKSVTNPRSHHWFQERDRPIYARRQGVRYPTYREQTARTDRFRNSPKNFLIRKLNQCL